MKRVFSCLVIVLWAFSIRAEIIPSEKLFSSPVYSMAQLSPDGKYLSVKERGDKKIAFTIVDIESQDTFVAGAFTPEVLVKKYVWLNDSKLHFNIRKGGENFEYILDFEFNNKNKDKGFYILQEGYLVNLLPDETEFVLFAKKDKKKPHYHRLYKILIEDLKSNNFKRAQLIDKTKKDIVSYFYDNRLKRIITTEVNDESETVTLKWRPLKNLNWNTLLTYNGGDYRIIPAGFITENVLAVLSNKNTDKIALHEFDITSQTLGKVLFQHPKYDLTNAEINNKGEVESVHYYQKGIYKKHHFDLQNKKLASRLEKTFKNQTAYVIDYDRSQMMNLIYTVASDYPGAYYLYDKSKDKIIRLYASYPELENYTFANTEFISVTGSDGTELEAFITQPKGIDHNTLLVMPHGGPIGIQETDYFNKNIQYLVNRGFTVLRVNFRGSAGYGKSFLEQGVGQFGKLIEEDITAAVNQVTGSHQYKHVCSIGSSYGGYSSVMLSMKHPEQYQCVIAAYGVYDLPLLFNTSNYRSGEDYQKYIAKVVGKLDDLHLNLSPVYSPEKLKAPLLLIAGKQDEISGIEQTNRFNFMLKRNKKPVETIFYGQTGHGHSSWWGERHEMASTVDFLYRTLSLKEPEYKELKEDENTSLATDYVLLADSYDFEQRVKRDPKKAYRYYLKAAEHKEKRALFNIGSYYHRGELVEQNIETAIEYYEESSALGYVGAYRRLGRLYMEGVDVTKDDDKAYQYLSKAYELEDSLLHTMLLGRFYCVADKKYKNMDKCFENFRLNGIEELSNKEQRTLYNKRQNEISKTFINGYFTTDELALLKSFIKDTYKLTHVDFELGIEEAGIFEYRQSDKYGQSGNYELVNEGDRVQGKEGEILAYGLKFSTDFSGIDSKKDKTVIIAIWSKLTDSGETKIVDNMFLWGNPLDEWSAIKEVSVGDDVSTYRLDIYNLNREKMYTRDFFINHTVVSGSEMP